MKNKGLWILLGVNIALALFFIISISTVQSGQQIFVLFGLACVILVETPIVHLINKYEDKSN